MKSTIGDIIELDHLARQDAVNYPQKRLLYENLRQLKGKHFTGIVGARGAGKTVLLKQLATSFKNSLYLSLDTTADHDLFDLAKHLQSTLGIEILLIDEIHFQKNYDEKLKKIYDFLKIKVVFTSSVALAMTSSAFDLSRRVQLTKLPFFSFREFIFFKTGELLPCLTLNDIINKNWTARHIRYSYLFESYLKGGQLPFSIDEPDPLPLLCNILQKILQRDIPSIAPLLVEEIGLLEKMLTFIGKSSVDGINYSSISHNIGITKYKAASYLKLMSQALVLHVIFPKGTNVMREPKVLMCPPYRLLFNEYSQAIGGLREDFFAEMMNAAGLSFDYLKSTRGKKTPDFITCVDNKNIVLEIGGKGKGRSQFKGITTDRKIILSADDKIDDLKRPLHLLGYLY
ncbi:ATP-binding protein [bacterium]|nr:ATP-binding protein [bacterium]